MNITEKTSSNRWCLKSPDGLTELIVEVRDGAFSERTQGCERNCLFYEVYFSGKPRLLPSRLGLGMAGAPPLVNNFRVLQAQLEPLNEVLRPFHGECGSLQVVGRELLVELVEELPPGRKLNVRFRCLDGAVAFRYEVPEQPGIETVRIHTEQTCFSFPDGCDAWETLHAQGRYKKVPSKDLGDGVERPLTVQYPDGCCASIAEAGMLNHPKAKLTTRFHFPRLTMWTPPQGTILVALDGPACGKTPFETSWRVIFFADRPAGLLGRSDLLKAFCPPPDLEDTDWIRAGKCLRVMQLCTEAGLAAVLFAAENGLQFIEFDCGWYGHEFDDGSDPSFVSVDPRKAKQLPPGSTLDLQRVIEAANNQGIGVFLYVNRRHLERHLDSLLPVFRSWGIAGIKFGFVQEGTQEWSSWLHQAVRKCADFRILVDIHDEYRPTGLSHTLPNLLTQEGICGNEEMPDPSHNVTLPFTRFMAGAADYTICHRFSNMEQRLKTTPAHQLAMAAVYFSPLQFLFWYGHPEQNSGLPELEWYRRIPTVWDETVGLAGAIGEYVAVARRSGKSWFLGAMTNEEPRVLEITTDFLPDGINFRARAFSDGPDASPGKPTEVLVSEFGVTRGMNLRLELRGSGGIAMILDEEVPSSL